MTVNEAIRHQWKQLKDKPLKAKIVHIISYFWIPIVTVLGLAVLLVSQVIHVANQKETVLHITFINTLVSNEQVEEYCLRVGSLLQLDPDKQIIAADTGLVISQDDVSQTYQNVQKFSAMVSAHETDLVVGNLDQIKGFAYSEYFHDLADILSEEQLANYKDFLLYMDGALIQDADPEKGPVTYPDLQSPENMKAPIPVALRIPLSAYLSDIINPNQKDEVIISVVFGAQNTANIVSFVEAIMEGKGGL